MKKFTKITLIIAAVFAMLGITLCCVASTVAGGFGQLRAMAENGELNFGNWHFEDGVYYRGENMLDVVEEINIDAELLPGGNEHVENRYEQEISCIEMELDLANVLIKVVDEDALTVSMENGYKKYYEEELEGDTLIISYDVGINNYKEGPDITINVPSHYVLDDIIIDTDLGNVEIRDFEEGCGGLDIRAALGNIEVYNCVIDGSSILQADMGNAQMTKVTCQDVELSSDMGEVKFEGIVNGDLTMTADMGTAKAKVHGKEADYNIYLSADMGDVTCNGTHHTKDMGGEYERESSDAKGDIYMHSSMGAVELSFGL